ncbi:MAG: DUF285 domain-containing protein [Candidatus Peribacteria bacterium]|nr:DUF285 domain-containing protein [Candidatus Peribacteria bacterium]
MFTRTQSFNQDISMRKIGSGVDMERMFDRALVFDKDLSNWNITGVVNISGMFLDSALSTYNYNQILN